MDLIEYERLNSLLQRVPVLVDLYEQREFKFLSEVKSWLRDTEDVLRGANSPIVSDISSHRAEIISAERGNRPVSVSLPARSSKRKVAEATAIQSLNSAQSSVLSVISDDLDAFTRADKSIRSLLVVANQKGLLNNNIQPPYTMPLLRNLWSALVSDDTIGTHTAQLLGLLRFRDALIMLGRVLEEWRVDQNGNPD
jgi:hypothetical protein